MNDRMYFMMVGLLHTVGIKSDRQLVEAIYKVRNLTKKLHRQYEYDANGQGYVRGKFYRTDSPAGYVDENTSVFQAEAERLEGQIAKTLSPYPIKVTFQPDPRGAPVILQYKGRDFSRILWM